MEQNINLDDIEKRAYGAYRRDGLLDILLGSFLSLWAIAPLLSSRLGDFWSSAIFLPIWGFLFLIARYIRLHVTTPRLGRVKYGAARKKKMQTITILMLGMNLLALGAGLSTYFFFRGDAPAPSPLVWAGIIMLAGFSVAAYFLDFPRLYIYGIMAFLSFVVGEWLYKNVGASHHGLPITFGVTSLAMMLVGVFLFVRFLRSTRLPKESEGEATS